jgi:hypothetical protein
MTYGGRIQGGAVILEAGVHLPEGTEVEVETLEGSDTPTWADVLKDVIGTAEGLPADSSRNHDHYLIS